MTDNTDGSVEIVILLTGGAGTLVDTVPRSRQQQVGEELAAALKESLKDRKLINVLGFLLWNDAVQGFFFRHQSGPSIY